MMLEKSKRYATIIRVFLKYNLFSLLYKDIHKDHISNKKCTCALDLKNRSNATKLRLAFEELGPSFIKLGQMLSKRPDLVPYTYILELEKLQDNVKPLDFDKMRESFETECICEMGKGDHKHHPTCYHCNDILDIFDELDTTPIASASIGQVYQGVINGKKVAVKIARPNLIDTINLDLEIINDLKPFFIKLMGVGDNFDSDRFLREFKEMLHNELDYKIEAMNMMRFHDNFEEVEDVIIPKVYLDYCRESVLVMDFIEGTLVKDVGDINQEIKSRYVQLISSSYLKQVYLDGFYHADPHGGNIVVKDGTVAFIDFGAVGKIDDELRRNMLNLFYAINKKKVDMAADAFLKIGKLNKEDLDISRFKWDIDELITKQHRGIGERKSDNYALLALKYNMSLPSEFSTLERALILVEAVCLNLNPNYNIMDEVRPVISKALKERYSPTQAVEFVQMEGDEYIDIFKNLPSGINDVIETIRGYKLERLEAKSNTLKRYRLLGESMRYALLMVLIISSVYLIIQGDFSSLGIVGFFVSLIMSAYTLRSSL
ncbi:AarF/ABC1/UbiB kinase family protein [Methanococcoides sp. AM1]|uniref:ABC1 kinase family protein n=1 Tax=Methanococcoides sp. AM1 TaxID=1201011 RepID=UPI001FCE6C69|nr:lipopolysaccharide core heptose(II) kinase RfaY [Methanococcoides sp. AM1]